MEIHTPIVSLKIPLPNGVLAATRYGNGARLLVVAHGYGETQANMRAIALAAAAIDYTVFTFDLPFHGDTVWEEETYSSSDFVAIIQWVVARETHKPLSLLGYSLGGQLVLATLSYLSETVLPIPVAVDAVLLISTS